ncbi:MAG TPA: histidine phosphatase family protein [Candidatus Limnocylindria bacterium]|nr:histidine phosphatase family protein [Candidatus Limnocylindria bacterium]
MTDERLLLLVRHGITAWNREGRFQGHLDPPLSDEGHHEAQLLARRLAAAPERPRRLISSSLGRARQTAEIVAAALDDLDVESDPRLMEIGQGVWEGRTHAELEVQDPVRYAAWRRHSDEQPPGAEPLDHALARVAELLDEVTDSTIWPICLVSHGGTLRLLARHLLSLGAPQTWTLDLDNASLSKLAWTDADGWRLLSWNDAHHLLGGGPTHVDESEGRPLAL